MSKKTLVLLIMTSVFALIIFGADATAQEIFECSEEVWTDGFTDYNSRWEWSYNAGTGYQQLNTIDSASVVEIGITDQSTSSSYSDCSLHEDSYQYMTGVFETRLRCSDDNGFNSPGQGTRGWGVWNYQDPANADAAWFWSASPESDAALSGFQAMVVRDSDIVFQQPLPGIDMREWHIYHVEFSLTGTRFFVDGIEVASTSERPNKPERSELWIDNYRVGYIDNSPTPTGYLDVEQDQMMYIDWVRYYDYQECTSCSEGIITQLCDCQGSVHDNGYCCPEGWQPTECVQVDVTIDYNDVLTSSPTYYGSNAFWTNEDMGLIRERMNKSNMNTMRLFITPFFIENPNDNPDPNSINWDGFNFSYEIPWEGRTSSYSAIFEVLRELDMHIMVDVPYLSPWLSANYHEPYDMYSTYPPNSYEEYEEFVYAVLYHMVNNVGISPDKIILEPFNEPDLGCGQDPAVNCFWNNHGMDDTVDAFLAACSAAESVSPNIRVMGMAEWNDGRYVRNFINNHNGLNYLDGITYHKYSYNYDISSLISMGTGFIDDYGIPVIVNEYGSRNWGSNGVDGALWNSYTLTNLMKNSIQPLQFPFSENPQSGEPYNSMGLFDDWNNDWQIKDSFWVYSNILGFMKDTDILNSDENVLNMDVLAGRGDGELNIIITNSDSGERDITIGIQNLPLDYDNIEIYDNFQDNYITGSSGISGSTFNYIVPARSSVTLSIAPSGSDTTPPIISNIQSSPSTTTAAITWQTDELADSLIRYGTAPGSYTDNGSGSSYVTSHSVTLIGLTQDTTYYYVANSTDQSGNSAQSPEHSFTTGGTGPVLYLRFEEGSGTTATDSSGISNHGDINGAVYSTNSKLGYYSLEFDGADGHVSVSDDDSLDITEGITISAWVYYRGRASGNQAWAKILTKPAPALADPWNMYSLGLDDAAAASQNVRFEISGGSPGSQQVVESVSVMPLNNWTHVAAVYDGSEMHIYINGVDENQNPTSITMGTNSEPLLIGNWPISTENKWNGLMDELRIYSRSLTPEEITELFEEGLTHRADTDSPLGCIYVEELTDFIGLWHYDSIIYPMREMMEAVSLWKSGAGCNP